MLEDYFSPPIFHKLLRTWTPMLKICCCPVRMKKNIQLVQFVLLFILYKVSFPVLLLFVCSHFFLRTEGLGMWLYSVLYEITEQKQKSKSRPLLNVLHRALFIRTKGWTRDRKEKQIPLFFSRRVWALPSSSPYGSPSWNNCWLFI